MNVDRAAVRAAAEAEAERLCAGLTRREREVLALMSTGMTAQAVGAMLGIAQATVETHCGAILRKLDVGRMIEAAVLAAKAGLV